jgi:hypothetical protein
MIIIGSIITRAFSKFLLWIRKLESVENSDWITLMEKRTDSTRS